MGKTLLDKETELCEQLQELCGDDLNLHTAVERLIAQVIYTQNWDEWQNACDKADKLLHEVKGLIFVASMHSELQD